MKIQKFALACFITALFLVSIAASFLPTSFLVGAVTTSAAAPSSGVDYTVTPSYTLVTNDFTALGATDSNYYTTHSAWTTSYNDWSGKRLHFEYSITIPAGSTITQVQAISEYRRSSGSGDTITAAKIRVYDGSSWTEHTLTAASSSSSFTTNTVPLTEINTIAELSALRIEFQATGASSPSTIHNRMVVTVQYTNPAALTIGCTPTSIVAYGSATTTIRGTLSSSGTGVTGKSISLSYQGGATGPTDNSPGSSWTPITSVTTTSGGAYTYTWNPTDTLASDYYWIRAQFAGDSDYAAVSATTGSSANNLFLDKASTAVTVGCSPTTVVVVGSGSTTISGNLGVSVSGKSISLSYQGGATGPTDNSPGSSWTPITSVTTTGSGAYSYSWNPTDTFAYGYYWIRSQFAGDTSFTASSAQTGTGSVVNPLLDKVSPTISLTAPTIAYVNVGFTVSASLSGATSSAGGTVTYTLYSGVSPTGTQVDTDTKNVASGVVSASKSFTILSPGSYYFVAVYSGDTNNKAATSNPQSLTSAYGAPAAADTYIRESSQGDNNYGTTTSINIRSSSGEQRFGLIRFNTPSIPAGYQVSSAKLRLYFSTVPASATDNLYRITSTWVETSVIWNTPPTYLPSVAAFQTVTSGGTGWKEFDVTAEIQAFLSGTQNNGWVIKTTSTNSNDQVINSKENSAYQPQLVLELTPITYTITVTQGAHGTISPPGTTTVNYGDNKDFTVTPAGGYHIDSITTDVGDVLVTSPLGQTVSFLNVQASHTLTASFALTIHSTSLTINVDPVAPVMVDKNSGQHATITGYLSSSGVGLKDLNGYDVIVSYNDGRTDLNNDGQSDWIVLGSPTTANNPDTSTKGFYTIDFPVTSSMANGYVAFKAEFAGDLANGYAPTNPNTPAVTGTAGQEEGNLHVVPEYLFGGLAALGVCFVGFVAFKKRSSLPHFKRL